MDKEVLVDKKVVAFRSWRRHFLICFNDAALKIPLLLFGTYRINERKDSVPRLRLHFATDQLNFYACSVQLITEPADAIYDCAADIMAEEWICNAALRKLGGSGNANESTTGIEAGRKGEFSKPIYDDLKRIWRVCTRYWTGSA